MAEIRHTFTAGKMNKDLDERLVPNGEYRDALNIEISTSSGTNIGAASTMLGNTELTTVLGTTMDATVHFEKDSKAVGSISDERTNRAFFFITPNVLYNSNGTISSVDDRFIGVKLFKDIIACYDDTEKSLKPVVVDIFELHARYNTIVNVVNGEPIPLASNLSSFYVTKEVGEVLKPGAEFYAIRQTGFVGVQSYGGGIPIVKKVEKENYQNSNGSCYKVTLNKQVTVTSSTSDPIKYIKFSSPRVLNFSCDNYITGVNIIDDLLFWTDNTSEPKKINIQRCLAGSTEGFNKNTKLFVHDPTTYGVSTLKSISDIEIDNDGYLKEQHITVIKKAPLRAPKLTMSNTARLKPNSDSEPANTTGAIDLGNNLDNSNNSFPSVLFDENELIVPGTQITLNSSGASNPVMSGFEFNTLLINDVLELETVPSTAEKPKKIRVEVVDIQLYGYPYYVMVAFNILSIDPNITLADKVFNVKLVQPKPMFEFKFCRFACRYKFDDGEYSSFSPWSELAFIPDDYEYEPNKGYNLGMSNTLRRLIVSNFIGNDLSRPDDVVAVDLLYKETSSNNVYVIKSVERGRDPEWVVDIDGNDSISVNITSELVDTVVPSDQSLRVWDNVPRFAKAQEITANRLIYGNYLQSYDKPTALSVHQMAISKNLNDPTQSYLFGFPSLKSLRNYKVGVVLGDKYGRETPVIASGTRSISTGEDVVGDFYVPKEKAKDQNRLSVKQFWDNSTTTVEPPEWASYCKYYVKETSADYYNLAMDRLYDAEDGNVWVSFMSSDRNKVDEDTYIILKKQHKSNAAIEEDARYKILAIENDAPKYIKEEHRVIAELHPPSVYSSIADGQQLHQQRELSWSGGAGANISFAGYKGFKGTGYARITAEANGGKKYFSVWKKVSHVNDNVGLGNLNTSVLRLADSNFGDTAKLHEQMADNGDTMINDGWRVEVKDVTEEDKPEYQGRFFVKILRDNVIETYIAPENTQEQVYYSIARLNVGHISTRNKEGNETFSESGYSLTQNQTVTGYSGSTDGWEGYNLGDFTGSSSDNLGGFATCSQGFDDSNGDSTFLNNYHTHTKDYWRDRADSNHPKFFIDDARAVQNPRYSNPTGYSGTQSLPPVGITSGTHSNNDGVSKARMFLSVSAKKGWSDVDSLSETEVRTPSYFASGKMFRFSSDPDSTIYRVLSRDVSTDEGINYHIHDCTNCQSYPTYTGGGGDTGYNKGCSRHTLIINFIAVSDNNGTIEESRGISDSWDPRGNARWDGMQSIGIDFVEVFRSSTEPEPASINSAVFETEPKEGPELDIYYEASNALPLVLSESNIKEFAPKDAVVKVIRNNAELNPSAWMFKGVDTDIPFETHLYAGGTLNEEFESYKGHLCISRHYDTNIKISRQYETVSGVWFVGATIGDVISIDHGGGLITETEVTGHNSDSGWEAVKRGYTCSLMNLPTGGLIQFIQPSAQIADKWWIMGVYEVLSTSSNVIPHTTSINPAYNTVSYNETQLQNGDLIVSLHLNNFVGGTSVNSSGQTVPNIIGLVEDNVDVKFQRITGVYTLDKDVYKYTVQLPWFNCYSFGNGVESNRIRDDFNASTIGKGFKASAVINEYGEERRGSGLIYSGIYNSTSGINRLNEFNMAESITKDLNPSYGSIQALRTRDTNLVSFCEDKVLKILASKDALFNADGNVNVTSSNKVLGSAIAFVGDYGISTNPESLAVDNYRMYFADKQRGKMLRLSQDGLTAISDIGMSDWFMENLKEADNIVGSYDEVLKEYNVTINHSTYASGTKPSSTVSFNEKIKGWTSFRSYILETGTSINSKYLTSKGGKIWLHHNDTVNANNFYGVDNVSTIDVLFNEQSNVVKNFKTINYEGSQAKINKFTTETVGSNTYSDNEYYNLSDYKGWYVSSITTDKQEGLVHDFVEKEGKWFNNISGVATDMSNLDTSEFTVQGIGNAKTISQSGNATDHILIVQNDPNQ